MNLLFVCHHNKMRSRTAEAIYAAEGVHASQSAGISPHAKVSLTPELLQWADLIFVMEARHEQHIRAEFPDASRGKSIIVLEIGDFYYFMEPLLVEMIRSKVDPYLNNC